MVVASIIRAFIALTRRSHLLRVLLTHTHPHVCLVALAITAHVPRGNQFIGGACIRASDCTSNCCSNGVCTSCENL
jgi:hypothetical protein